MVWSLANLFVPCAHAAAEARETPTVYVTNYPLQYFAQRIVGAKANIVFPIPKEVDPAFWTPDLAAVLAYQKAGLILLNGAGYESWIDQVSLPQRKLVDTSAPFKSQHIQLAAAVTHGHGPRGEHTHAATAFTTWLDFKLAERQAQAIAGALARLFPMFDQSIRESYGALKQDLSDLDQHMRRIVARDPSQAIFGSHPVYQYLARAYGLNMRTVHWEPDVPPSKEQWAELKRLLQEHQARWMIWEKQPMADTVTRLETLEVNSLVFDPCGNVPDQGDFLRVMRQNLKNLEQAFKKPRE